MWYKMNLMECGLKGISCLFLDLLYETEPCMLQSGLGTVVAPKAHGKGSSTQNFHPDSGF